MASESKPSWEKSSPRLVALFEELSPKEPAVVQKKMFGWPCCFVNGNLFLGLHNQSIIFRLSDADRLDFLKVDGAGDFEPMPGRKMKGYTILADPLTRDRRELEVWVKRSLEFARALPSKTKPKPAIKRTKTNKARPGTVA